MRGHDLDRVNSDLASMRRLCAEPDTPLGVAIAPNLALAAGGLALAIAPRFMPFVGVQIMAVVFAVVGAMVYVPWQRWHLTREAETRRLERQELAASMVATIGTILFVLARRFATPGEGGYPVAEWTQDAAAVCYFVGLGACVNGTIHATRRSYVIYGACFALGGLLLPFATTTRDACAIFGTILAIGGGGTAAWTWLWARYAGGVHGDH